MKNTLINLTIAVASLFFFGGLIEGGLRLAGVSPEPPLATLFSWREIGELWFMGPGTTWRTRVGNHLVRVNSLGLRGDEIPPCRPGVFRILFLGDSVTFGHEQPGDVIFVSLLQERLSRPDRSVEVINAGIPGWSTRQQYLFYRERGEDLCPDLVLVGFVLNDITELQRGEIELSRQRGARALRAITWLAQRSALFGTAKRLYAAALDPAGIEIRAVLDLARSPNQPEVEHAMALTERELEKLARLARERNDRFGLVLFPFRFQLEHKGLDAPQQRLVRAAAASGVPVLDTLPDLSSYDPAAVLLDHDHFNTRGHAVVAGLIADWLQREAMLEKAGGQPGISSPAAR